MMLVMMMMMMIMMMISGLFMAQSVKRMLSKFA